MHLPVDYIARLVTPAFGLVASPHTGMAWHLNRHLGCPEACCERLTLDADRAPGGQRLAVDAAL
jgi:hypothetical protein